MPELYIYSLDYSQPVPHRTLKFPQLAPVQGVLSPADDQLERHHLLAKDDIQSKKWRGHVGTFIAHQLGYDITKAWHIEDFPPGYSLWIKRRADSLTRHDLYLYGYGGRKKFSSPQEFAFHALWLYAEAYRATNPCPCILDTGMKQGQINEKWIGIPMQLRRSPQRQSGRSGDGESADLMDVVAGQKAKLFRFVASNRRILQSGAGRGAPDIGVPPQRDADLTAPRQFRPGELVWVSIPRLRPEGGSQADFEEMIAFWPALIREARVKPITNPHQPGEPYANVQSQVYWVLLLAVGSSHVVEQTEVLSWQAYQFSRVVREAMQKAFPPVEVTSELPELDYFDPLPSVQVTAYDRPQARNRQRGSIPRTYENALCPLSVAYRTAKLLTEHYFLTDNYQDTTQVPSRTMYQGLWWGPERIWLDDLIRLAVSRDELETKVRAADLREASPGAERRGLFAQITEMTSDQSRDGALCFSARLYELQDLAEDAMDEDTRLPQPVQLSAPARAHQGPYPLPQPPLGFRWRCITAPDSMMYLPAEMIAGRYDPLPGLSGDHCALLGHIINEVNIAKFEGGESMGDSMDHALKRVLGLVGLGSGKWNVVYAWRWKPREKAVMEAQKEARNRYFERWSSRRT